MQSIVLGETES